ncbi:hypothetical protein HPB48_007114 [Haemaphysalis longicornis]|uniref:Uncharacterized protein n=1 Tax=Haemaphysalis longicornis TaxID=44386 RepID=A0A9J6GIL6_HAELO|nr:hypothetical protein HPB48_007114 [Haemaphysalis longicornis]
MRGIEKHSIFSRDEEDWGVLDGLVNFEGEWGGFFRCGLGQPSPTFEASQKVIDTTARSPVREISQKRCTCIDRTKHRPPRVTAPGMES